MVEKAAGKTASGLSSCEEPYYNKLLEICEEKVNYDLKEVAMDIHKFIEQTVLMITDWTRKTDFKRDLEVQNLRSCSSL